MATKQKERVDYARHLAALVKARQDYELARTTAEKVAAKERGEAAHKACETSRAAWKALPDDVYQVALRDGLTPAQALAAKAEIRASLWPHVVTGKGVLGGTMTATMALSASRAGARAAHRASPEGRRAAAVAKLEGEVRAAAVEATTWRARASERGVPNQEKALALRAAGAADRRFMQLRANLRDVAPGSSLAFAEAGEIAPKSSPLPTDIKADVAPMLALGRVLGDISAAAGDDAITAKMLRALRDAAGAFLEIAPEHEDAVGQLLEMAATAHVEPAALLAAIASFAEATGVPVQHGPPPRHAPVALSARGEAFGNTVDVARLMRPAPRNHF